MKDDARDPRKNPDKPANEKDSSETSSASSGDVAVDASGSPPTSQNPQPPNARNKPHHQCRERRENWELGIEIATFVAVVIYAAIAAFQWCATLAANRNSTNALHVTERAY